MPYKVNFQPADLSKDFIEDSFNYQPWQIGWILGKIKENMVYVIIPEEDHKRAFIATEYWDITMYLRHLPMNSIFIQEFEDFYDAVDYLNEYYRSIKMEL